MCHLYHIPGTLRADPGFSLLPVPESDIGLITVEYRGRYLCGPRPRHHIKEVMSFSLRMILITKKV